MTVLHVQRAQTRPAHASHRYAFHPCMCALHSTRSCFKKKRILLCVLLRVTLVEYTDADVSSLAVHIAKKTIRKEKKNHVSPYVAFALYHFVFSNTIETRSLLIYVWLRQLKWRRATCTCSCYNNNYRYCCLGQRHQLITTPTAVKK